MRETSLKVKYLRWLGIIGLSLNLSLFSNSVIAQQGGVILLYHHVSESTPAITSVTPEQFQQHIDYLSDNDFSVVSLSRILASASAETEELESSDRLVAISFDDAYESVYSVAYPILKDQGWPFSVFVASEAIDRGYGGFMSWQQLRDLNEYGAEIGGHSVSHAHLVRMLDAETENEWVARISREIDQGNLRIEQELGIEVDFFAYPYGEFTPKIKQMVSARDLFGLAQQSGAVGETTDLLEIPRYPMARSSASMERFSLVTKTKALPVTEIEPGEVIRTHGQAPGNLSFSLITGDYRSTSLACYSSTGQVLNLSREGQRVIVELPDFVAGRNKVNCTAPSSSEAEVFYWFSQQWIVKNSDGSWPRE